MIRKYFQNVFTKIKHGLGRIKFLKIIHTNLMFIRHSIREGIWRSTFALQPRKAKKSSQSIITWNIKSPPFSNSDSFLRWLKENDIHVNEGRCTIYIPPQSKIRDLIPDIVKFYPKNCGFKILKDFQSPESAEYLINNDILVRSMLTGTLFDLLRTANYMNSLSIGPRVWDICCWENQNVSLTVFVVEHVDGTIPTVSQCLDFINKLKQLLINSHLRITVPNWEKKSDFKVPDCNGNLLFLEKSGQAQYIDFQNFSIANPLTLSREIIENSKEIFHFGNGRLMRGEKYLYQSVPGMAGAGKRNTEKRWEFLYEQITRSGIKVEGRLVFDIGCNSGMIVYSSLLSGALWGLGWDLPKIVESAQSLLLSLGTSRFNLFGANLKPSYSIEQDIPTNLLPHGKESIIFYLSVRQHIGVLESLKTMPWRVFVYEGHQSESLDEIPLILKPLLKNDVEITVSTFFADGDSRKRPFVILVRK